MSDVNFRTNIKVGCESCPQSKDYCVERSGVVTLTSLNTSGLPLVVTETIGHHFAKQVGDVVVDVNFQIVNTARYYQDPCVDDTCPFETKIAEVNSAVEDRIDELSRHSSAQ